MVAEDGMWGHVGLRDTSGAYPCSWLSAAALLLSLAQKVPALHAGMVGPCGYSLGALSPAAVGPAIGAASWLSIWL